MPRVNDNGNFAWMGVNALNQYTSLGGAAGYDERFNLRHHGGVQYDYDAANRLVSGTGNGQSAGFDYDGLGRCLKRTVNGAVTVIAYDGWKPTVEWAGDGSYYAYNVYGAGPDEILWRYDSRPGYGHLRYHHDRHGNVTSLLNVNGSIIEKYSYDAFGAPKVTDPSGNDRKIGGRYASWYGNRFLFQGREWIHELGIYDYRHRMYQPELGRFLQTDPLGLQTEGVKLTAGQKSLFSPGGLAPEVFTNSETNLYRYCSDDPIDRTDPTGLEIAYDFSDPSNKAAMEAHLSRLERMGGEIGSMVKQLRDSSNKITFGDIQRDVRGWDKNNLPPRDPKDNTFRTTPRNEENSRNGKGTGSYVEINPKDSNSASGTRDPVEGAGHEVRHAAANDKGNRLPGNAEEQRAQKFQLEIRKKIKEGH